MPTNELLVVKSAAIDGFSSSAVAVGEVAALWFVCPSALLFLQECMARYLNHEVGNNSVKGRPSVSQGPSCLSSPSTLSGTQAAATVPIVSAISHY